MQLLLGTFCFFLSFMSKETVVTFLAVFPLVFFFYGLVKYIREPEIDEGKKVMIAGILSLFIMVSIWGLVNLAQNAFGVSGNGTIVVPQVQQSSGL